MCECEARGVCQNKCVVIHPLRLPQRRDGVMVSFLISLVRRCLLVDFFYYTNNYCEWFARVIVIRPKNLLTDCLFLLLITINVTTKHETFTSMAEYRQLLLPDTSSTLSRQLLLTCSIGSWPKPLGINELTVSK